MIGDSGNGAIFHFCPDCGSDVYYARSNGEFDDLVAIPLGAFDDPYLCSSRGSRCGKSASIDWVAIVGDEVEHFD